MSSTANTDHGDTAQNPNDEESVAAPASAAEGSQPDEAYAGTLAEWLEQARRERDEYRDQCLRATAEAENVRRRSEQEIAKVRKFAVEGFAGELLPVKDSLDLAAAVELGSAADEVVKAMHEGLELTRRQLDSVFEKFGIAVLEPARGDRLDPERHQAMSLQESDEVAPNHVLQVIQKGFTLNDRLLRPAMVIVARAPAG